jgi:hypothetical protein
MVQGDIVKRSWSKNSQISEHTDILDIWDTGSHIYERWPNGDEFYWKIISRDLSDNGFTEILEQQALWQTPGKVLRREQIPLLRQSASKFQMGGWSVEQEVEKPSNTKEEHIARAHRPQAHIAQAHNYKKNTSSQKAQRGPQAQRGPRAQRGPQVTVQ